MPRDRVCKIGAAFFPWMMIRWWLSLKWWQSISFTLSRSYTVDRKSKSILLLDWKTLLNKLTRHAIILDVFLTFPSNNWFMWLKLHRLLREEHCNRGEIEDSEIYQSIEAVIYSRQHSEDQTFDIDSYDIHLCQDLRNKDWGGTIKWNQIYQFYLSLMLKMFFFSITNLQSDTRIDSFFLSASSSSIFHSLNFIGGFDCVICISIPL